MRRVIVETRKAYVIDIGGTRRRFWTEAAAYYKLAASLVGQKYLGPLKAAERGELDATVSEVLGLTLEQAHARAERAAALFYIDGDSYHGEPSHFDTRRWQLYIRRVAAKMRAMDRNGLPGGGDAR